MLDLLQRGLQGRTESSGQLTIDRRVLVTPKSTIGIASVSSVTSGTVGVTRRGMRRLAIALSAAGIALLAGGLMQGGVLLMISGAASFAAGLMLLPFATTATPCLTIATRGGGTFHFLGQRRTLEEGRRLLTNKINTGDEVSAFRIHFEKGIVQPLGHAEPVASLFADIGNQAPGHGDERAGDFHPHAPAGLERVNGHVLNAGGFHVDYAPVLGQIADMQRFYACRPDTQEIAGLLSEMEYLMRSGTPTGGGRQRLDQLARELTTILAAYPHVVQIFRQAAHLAAA
jgi:hypothetical protein